MDVGKVQNSIENNTYLNNNIYTNQRVWGDTVYKLRNDMGILNMVTSSYSQLIAVYSTGEEIILYDVNSDQLIKHLIVCGIIAVMILTITVIVLWRYPMNRRS